MSLRKSIASPESEFERTQSVAFLTVDESSFLRQALPASIYDDSTFPTLPRNCLAPPWSRFIRFS